jgi:3-oxoacyl-[acyl-carrier protein] reductase
MAKLTGKVAVVTSASKGIGAAIAEELAQEGAAVIVNYASSRQQAETLVTNIKSGGGKAKAVRANISKPVEAKQLVDAAVSEFGQLDIPVNNTGVYDFAPLPQITEEHFDRMFDLNVKGLLFATQAATSVMGKEGGRVINIGSVASVSAPPGASVYSATKGAVDVLTKSLAAELGARKILVNAVLPGPVDTEENLAMADADQINEMFIARMPLGRIGQPRDIATVVSFLASPEASWITGQIIQRPPADCVNQSARRFTRCRPSDRHLNGHTIVAKQEFAPCSSIMPIVSSRSCSWKNFATKVSWLPRRCRRLRTPGRRQRGLC